MAKLLVPTLEDLLQQVAADQHIWIGQEIHYRQGQHLRYATFYVVISSLCLANPSRFVPIQYRILVDDTDEFSFRLGQEKIDEEIKKHKQMHPYLLNGVVTE